MNIHVVRVGIIGCIMATLGASGCASPGKRTAIGAGAGAGGGALIGGLAGGGKGALIGAGIGALTGGAVGNYLDKQANELQQVADTKRTEDGILVNLKNDLLFDTGKTDLKPAAIPQLNQLAVILVKYPEDRIRIAGFTDSVGSTAVNQALSQQRAQVVRDVLSQHGVNPSQMTVEGYGKSRPVASNDTAQGRSKNRRVELHIDIPKQQAGQAASSTPDTRAASENESPVAPNQ